MPSRILEQLDQQGVFVQHRPDDDDFPVTAPVNGVTHIGKEPLLKLLTLFVRLNRLSIFKVITDDKIRPMASIANTTNLLPGTTRHDHSTERSFPHLLGESVLPPLGLDAAKQRGDFTIRDKLALQILRLHHSLRGRARNRNNELLFPKQHPLSRIRHRRPRGLTKPTRGGDDNSLKRIVVQSVEDLLMSSGMPTAEPVRHESFSKGSSAQIAAFQNLSEVRVLLQKGTGKASFVHVIPQDQRRSSSRSRSLRQPHGLSGYRCLPQSGSCECCAWRLASPAHTQRDQGLSWPVATAP